MIRTKRKQNEFTLGKGLETLSSPTIDRNPEIYLFYAVKNDKS